jgi:murein DD-endopeptidase MepM/ murein hydrolase activator NlpD
MAVSDEKPDVNGTKPNEQAGTDSATPQSGPYDNLIEQRDLSKSKKFTGIGSRTDFSTVIQHILVNGKPVYYEEKGYNQGVVIEVIKDIDVSSYPGGATFTKPITGYKIIPTDRIPRGVTDVEILKASTRIFYPPGDSYESTFEEGELVRITFPKNYPDNVNELDNRYHEKVAGAANTAVSQEGAAAPTSDAPVTSTLNAATTNEAPPANAEIVSTNNVATTDYRAQITDIVKKMSPEDFLEPPTKSPIWMTSPVTTGRVDPAPPPGQSPKVLAHAGVDLALRAEMVPIYAGADGEIVAVKSAGGGGNSIMIKHKHFSTYHGHLKAFAVMPEGTKDVKIFNGPDPKKGITGNLAEAQKALVGKKVKAGEIIGAMGNTGTHTSGQHLHWQYFSNDTGGPGNIIYLMKKYGYMAGPAVKKKYNLKTGVIQVPFQNPGAGATTTADNDSSKQPKPEDKTGSTSKDPSKPTGSPPRTRPKLKLLRFKPDFSTSARTLLARGSPDVLLREDVNEELLKIKKTLNKFNINLSLESRPISLSLPNSNILEMSGMQVNLNSYSALHPDGNTGTDTYLVSFLNKNGIKVFNNLNIWAKVNVGFDEYDGLKVYKGKLTVLNIKETYKKRAKPVEIETYGSFINLSDLFSMYGFINAPPSYQFIKNSDYKFSNWNSFYYIKTLNKGITTAREVLETVYYNDGEPIWNNTDKVWNGEAFVG